MPFSSPRLFAFVKIITDQFLISNLVRVRIKNEGKLQVKYFRPGFENETDLHSKLLEYKSEIEKLTGQKIHTIELKNADCCHERCLGCVNYEEG